MKSAGGLGGILFKENVPIIEFKYKSGMLVYTKMLTDDKRYIPFEFISLGIDDGLDEWIMDRPTPDMRIGIHEKLKETPIQYYNVERMLRYCHAQSVHDCYWIKQDNDISCWIGSPLEGIGIKPNERYEDLETAQRWK